MRREKMTNSLIFNFLNQKNTRVVEKQRGYFFDFFRKIGQ